METFVVLLKTTKRESLAHWIFAIYGILQTIPGWWQSQGVQHIVLQTPSLYGVGPAEGQ